MNADELGWNRALCEQREFHRNHRLRPRLRGLTGWPAGVRGLGEAGLRAPVGPKEPFPQAPTALIHREQIHRLSEVRPLRDLYPHMGTARNGAAR